MDCLGMNTNTADAKDPRLPFRRRKSRSLVDEPATAEATAPARAQASQSDTQTTRTSFAELSTIIKSQLAFLSIQGRTHEELQAYLDLTDQEFTAIGALRRFVCSSGSHVLPSPTTAYPFIQIAPRKDHDVSRSSVQSIAGSSIVSASPSNTSGIASRSSVARSSWSTVDSNPPIKKRISGNTPSSLQKQHIPLPNHPPNSETVHQVSPPQSSYWCTVCEHPRRFETSGGWIKHEKEAHEKTVYVCMPDGPTVRREHESVCVLCGEINPDESHLKKHNVAPCLMKASTARTYNRRYQLEKHMESHGVAKDSTITKGWRRDCYKQAWACGFCVAYFSRPTERFYHIATQHYDRGDDLSKWDASKVILGLLQQPKVRDAWNIRMKLQFPHGKQDLRWDRTPTRSLITMLELGLRGNEDGEGLATAAFIQSDHYQGRIETIPLPNQAPLTSKVAHREYQINRGLTQGFRRLSSDLFDDREHPTSAPGYGWVDPDRPQPLSSQSGYKVALGPDLGVEVSSGLPVLREQSISSMISPTLKNFEAHPVATHSSQQVEHLPWPGLVTDQTDLISLYDVDDPNFSWSSFVTSTTGLMNTDPPWVPPERHPNLNVGNNFPTPQTFDLVSKFSPQYGTAHDRLGSPMDLDLDSDELTRLLLGPSE